MGVVAGMSESDPTGGVSPEAAHEWLVRSRRSQGLPLKVDDLDLIVDVVRLLVGGDPDDPISVSRPE